MPANTEGYEDRPPGPAEQGWAAQGGRLNAPPVPEDAVNLNVDGRKLTGPLQGFGQLWKKTYQVRLAGATIGAQALIADWKENFPRYWPAGNHFYSAAPRIRPGQTAVLNLSGPSGQELPGGRPLISTGVKVVYADDTSFSFMTPEGHMFAGIITFSAWEDDPVTTAQIQALIRAGDPLYELAFRLGIGHRTEDQFWQKTLENLAAQHGVSQPLVRLETTCLDRRMQWSEAKHIWKNAAIRTGLYHLVAPVRWLGGRLRPKA